MLAKFVDGCQLTDILVDFEIGLCCVTKVVIFS